jgi:hypothetical protein
MLRINNFGAAAVFAGYLNLAVISFTAVKLAR